jgi:hypothetical protein
MARPTAPAHLADGELLHLVDGDGSAPDAELWTRHASGCAECSLRLEQLRRRSARVSVLLEEIGPPPGFRHPVYPDRRRHRSSPWMRAAAVFLLLAAAALTVSPPLRARVAEWIAGLRRSKTAAVWARRAQPATLMPPEAESGSTLWFTPATSRIRVDVDSRQAAGELRLRTISGAEGTFEMRDARKAEMPLLTASGLRIRNSAGSAARYEVGVPRSVTEVRLRIGDEPPRILNAEDLREGRSVDLRADR